MIYQNLSGTTSKDFVIGPDGHSIIAGKEGEVRYGFELTENDGSLAALHISTGSDPTSAVTKDYLATTVDAINTELSKKSDAGHSHVISNITDLGNATTTLHGLMTPDMLSKLNGIDVGAQKNLIESITIANAQLPIKSKVVDIPLATQTSTGVIKGSNSDNMSKINTDGTIEINTVNVSRIIQTDSDKLVISCGTSKV